jgi:hypothetical protein
MIKIGISILLALLISHIIGKYFTHVTLHGPDSNDIKKTIYKSPIGHCYKMNPIAHLCPLHTQGK